MIMGRGPLRGGTDATPSCPGGKDTEVRPSLFPILGHRWQRRPTRDTMATPSGVAFLFPGPAQGVFGNLSRRAGATRAQGEAMDRERRRQELLRLFNEIAPIARTFGMRLAFTDDDRAVVTLPYNPGLDHAMGGVHGGVYATLLDTAGWFTAAVRRKGDCWIATSELSVHFLRPVREAGLRAEGDVIKQGRRQDVVEMRLYAEGEDLVGHATGTFLVLPHIPLAPTLAGEGGGS